MIEKTLTHPSNESPFVLFIWGKLAVCVGLAILELSIATLKSTVSGYVRGMKLERHFWLADCNCLLEIYPGHLLLTRSVGAKDL